MGIDEIAKYLPPDLPSMLLLKISICCIVNDHMINVVSPVSKHGNDIDIPLDVDNEDDLEQNNEP